ncbi:uncharacterized protein [Anser cygnoides]|uniref:uncharacterized protein n=1 Tax=Anser cygnoides TaxID=8845 RepID=UPI0034D1BB4B
MDVVGKGDCERENEERPEIKMEIVRKKKGVRKDDDDVGSRYPASQLDHGLEPQEDPRGSTGQVPPWNPAPEPASMGPTGAVLVGSGYSTPQPDVDHEPQVNLPGPLTAKDNAEIRKSSPTSPDIIEDIIKELEEAAPVVRAVPCKHWYPASSNWCVLAAVPRIWFKEEQFLVVTLSCFLSKELVRETVPKEVLWRGSGRKLPLPGKITGATQATAPPGPLRAKDKAERVKPSLRSSHITGKIRKYFEKAAPGLVRETVPKKVLWRGSGRTLPLPGKRTEPVKSTAPPGVDGENNANTAKPQDFLSFCVVVSAVVVTPLLLVIVACWVREYSALEAEKPAPRRSPGSPDIDTRSRSVSPYRQPDHRGTPESQARCQQPPSVPGRAARLPPARPPRPPRPAADQWKVHDRPSSPQSSWTQTSPPRPPPPSSKGWGSPPRDAALATLPINIE